MDKGHTPGPWHVDPKAAEDSFFEDVNILRHDGLAVAVCVQNDDIVPPAPEANAAFIVRAVNSHYELLEALKACRLELDHCQRQLAAHGQTGAPNDSVSRALAGSAAALSRATEGGA
ncbi:hypothetical protein [Sphingopyxis sp. NJF-3]